MILTKEIARQYIGSYVDSYNRHNVHRGLFPKRIVEMKGVLYLRDPLGVYTRIEDSGFNALDIDYILDTVKVFNNISDTEVIDDTKI